MTEVGKTSGTEAPRAVVYDLVKRRRVAAPELAEATDSDSAGITEGARELKRALDTVQAAPETRPGRVRALKHQVQSGAYKPDPREIAREILERGF